MDKALILGGTNFIGRNLVTQLLKDVSYELTLFNRANTNPDLFPKTNKLIGDRNTEDIHSISKENWDCIVDLSCYFPETLSKTLQALKSQPKQYVFISTCSVYDNDLQQSTLRNENSPTLICSDTEKIDESPSTYGKRKAECERILKKSGLKYTILRPALVYGKYDKTDRLYYWLYNVKKQNQLLIPNNSGNIFSVTYVNDLVEAIIKSIQMDGLRSDIYNVITYPNLSIALIIDLVSKLVKTDPLVFSVSSNFLKANNIKEWTDLPLWIDNNYFTFNGEKMLNDFQIEPTIIRTSLKETINYYDKLNWQLPKYGIAEKQKLELINKSSL
ncbi:NAD-dependent epimerase/dehydratase family protein [Winogradskyella flava]|uniref:NAD-dependent epimerase/dehydratase family protein n=1 Tax=Winogradskyella flava TaxID=1884876 RepID=A0A842IQE5_9FLAO|nr:NAD-dependent epimerase/dehydratase family protein [Winogradskyella flava]MBC2845432.1 NAD-dependent epimerase/dehydratase family protein [Winogradskyella flava]